MTIREIAKEHPLLTFFSLAYLFAWLSWLPLILSRTGIGYLSVKIPMPFVIVGTFGPFFAGLITHKLTKGRFGFFNFKFSLQAMIFGLFVGFILIASAFIIIPSAILTISPLTSINWKAFSLYPSLIIHMIFLAAGPLGEEPGWRGFALPRLLKIHSPFWASLILGLLWFGWHLPLFLIPTWTSSPMVVFAIIIISFSFIMTFVYNISKGNLIIAIITHAIFNSSPFVLNAFLANAKTRNFISTELLLALSFLFIATMLLIFTRGRLGQVSLIKKETL